MEEVLRHTSLAHLASPSVILSLNTSGHGRSFRHARGDRDHFHCTVESPHGHVRCGLYQGQEVLKGEHLKSDFRRPILGALSEV